MIPIGFEYGFRKPLHVVETTPADWEPPAWDLTGPIGAINRAKAARLPLNEEGALTPVDLADERLFAFEKATRDGRERLLAVLNLERARSVPASIAAWRPGGSARVALDPLTGASQPVPDGRLLLPPAAVRLVHPA
jgi:hypothetical protein